MWTGREFRLPIDLRTPAAAQDPKVVTEYVKNLPKTIVESHHIARQHLRTAQNRQKEYYDRQAHGQPLDIGQFVLLRSNNPTPIAATKFCHQWKGPYEVVRIVSEASCLVKEAGQNRKPAFIVHFNQLKPYSQSIQDDRSLQADQVTAASCEVEVTTSSDTGTVSQVGGDGVTRNNQFNYRCLPDQTAGKSANSKENQ